jgi:hypothetical protein
VKFVATLSAFVANHQHRLFDVKYWDGKGQIEETGTAC